MLMRYSYMGSEAIAPTLVHFGFWHAQSKSNIDVAHAIVYGLQDGQRCES
jgi:hypothetical protein